jgi:steroid delta-isomerase-like uncharacterized protein
MSTEENKELVRLALEVANEHNLSEYAQHFTPNSKFYGFAPQPLDLEGYKQLLAMVITAFPDWHLNIEDMIAEGDKVVTRYTISGTHQREFQGIPPTGKQFTITAITIGRIVNGKAVELRNEFDQLGMLQQLGVIPSMG